MGLTQEYMDKVSAENPIFKKLFEALEYDRLDPDEKEAYHSEADKARAERYFSVAKYGGMRKGVEVALKLRAEGVAFDIISRATEIRLDMIGSLSKEMLD